MTVPGILSSSFAAASAPERSLQSAISPAPTRTAVVSVLSGILRDAQSCISAKLNKATRTRRDRFCRKADAPLNNSEWSANFFSARTSETLKLEPQHELQLPGQTRAGVGGCHVVVVDVEVHRRGNDAEVRLGGQQPWVHGARRVIFPLIYANGW